MAKGPAPQPLAPPSPTYVTPVLMMSPSGGYYYPASPMGGYGYMYSPVLTPPNMQAPVRMLFRRDGALLPTPQEVPVSPHPLLTPVALRHREKLAASAAAALAAAQQASASQATPAPPRRSAKRSSPQ
jgi:hypothetical protein